MWLFLHERKREGPALRRRERFSLREWRMRHSRRDGLLF